MKKLNINKIAASLLIACNSSNLTADSPFQGFKGGVSIGLSAQKGSRDVKRSPSYLGGSGLADGFGGDLHPWAWPQDRGRASLLNEYRAQQHADASRMRRALNVLRVSTQAAAAENSGSRKRRKDESAEANKKDCSNKKRNTANESIRRRGSSTLAVKTSKETSKQTSRNSKRKRNAKSKSKSKTRSKSCKRIRGRFIGCKVAKKNGE